LNVEQKSSQDVYTSNLTFKDMKTINSNKSNFPRPYKFTIYLIAVSIVGIMNWVVLSANDPGIESTRAFETRLAEALAPIADPEPELEDWILSISDKIISGSEEANTSLESRLAKALEPVDEPEPELEDWLLYFSDDALSGIGQ
jgi:hypothetical protein